MYMAGALAAIAIAGALGKGWRHVGDDATRGVLAAGPGPQFDAQRFLLNALLVPSLDADALPLRFADPRGAMNCAVGTVVLIDGKPIAAQALVPDASFDMDVALGGCRPFGASGPRFDGHVHLHVFREDWGFTATVESDDLRITARDGSVSRVTRAAVSMPQEADVED
jgi:hypothetical protein